MAGKILERLVVNQAGALVVGLLVAYVLLADHRKLLSRRNFALLALFLVAPFLVDVIKWRGRRAAWAFTAIFLATGFVTLWSLRLGLRGHSMRWRANLPQGAVRIVLLIVLVMNLGSTFGRPADDAGIYTNLGTRRFLETGRLPYGDPMLRGPDAPAHGAAATYGPLLYLSHMPFQLATGAHSNPADRDPRDPEYVRPPMLATQLTCFTWHLLGLLALFLILRGLAGTTLALAGTALFAGSPYVQGLGGDRWLAGGLVFISHIAPAAAMLLAFLAIRRAFLSGLLLAAGAGLLYFPAFVFPLWAGWRLWRKEGLAPFVAGFAIGGVALVALVVAFTPSVGDQGPVSLFLDSTLEHQEGAAEDEYGKSPFSFWGTHPGLADVFHTPLVGSSSLFKPTFLLFAAYCIAMFFFAKGRSIPQLAALTASVAAGLQLWKSHATGTYVEWYLPFLVIALLGTAGGGEDDGPD